MTKRTKAPAMQEVSQEQAERVMGEYANVDAKIQELTAEMDQRITAIREKYADKLEPLTAQREEKFKVLQFFAEMNKELFSKKRSLDFTHGVLGFRRGTPKLKTKKGFTWAAVLELCKDYATDWVRVKEEPNKELMLAQRDDETRAQLLDKVGVFVDADESFFVDLKKEEAALV